MHHTLYEAMNNPEGNIENIKSMSNDELASNIYGSEKLLTYFASTVPPRIPNGKKTSIHEATFSIPHNVDKEMLSEFQFRNILVNLLNLSSLEEKTTVDSPNSFIHFLANIVNLKEKIDFYTKELQQFGLSKSDIQIYSNTINEFCKYIGEIIAILGGNQEADPIKELYRLIRIQHTQTVDGDLHGLGDMGRDIIAGFQPRQNHIFNPDKVTRQKLDDYGVHIKSKLQILKSRTQNLYPSLTNNPESLNFVQYYEQILIPFFREKGITLNRAYSDYYGNGQSIHNSIFGFPSGGADIGMGGITLGEAHELIGQMHPTTEVGKNTPSQVANLLRNEM